MKITKDIEIEIDINDLRDGDLLDELQERIECNFILCREEYQKEKQPEIDAMVAKLNEIRNWLM